MVCVKRGARVTEIIERLGDGLRPKTTILLADLAKFRHRERVAALLKNAGTSRVSEAAPALAPAAIGGDHVSGPRNRSGYFDDNLSILSNKGPPWQPTFLFKVSASR
jgi:hypothetical protein